MKRTLLSITSIFMIAAILANTAGITIYPHFCKEEGEVTLNFFKKENCCAEKHHVVKKEIKHACCQKNKSKKSGYSFDKKDNCCKQDSFTAQWKLNEFSFQKNFQISVPFIFIEKEIMFVLLPEQSSNVNSKIESPPLFYNGRDILVNKQSFLI